MYHVVCNSMAHFSRQNDSVMSLSIRVLACMYEYVRVCCCRRLDDRYWVENTRDTYRTRQIYLWERCRHRQEEYVREKYRCSTFDCENTIVRWQAMSHTRFSHWKSTSHFDDWMRFGSFQCSRLLNNSIGCRNKTNKIDDDTFIDFDTSVDREQAETDRRHSSLATCVERESILPLLTDVESSLCAMLTKRHVYWSSISFVAENVSCTRSFSMLSVHFRIVVWLRHSRTYIHCPWLSRRYRAKLAEWTHRRYTRLYARTVARPTIVSRVIDWRRSNRPFVLIDAYWRVDCLSTCVYMLDMPSNTIRCLLCVSRRKHIEWTMDVHK
jgi:hypothetical protein